MPRARTILGRTIAPSSRVREILARLAEDPDPAGSKRRIIAVLVTDIERPDTKPGEVETEQDTAVIDRHHGLLVPVIEEHRGSIIEILGDAILARFGSAGQAVDAAVAMQLRLKERNAGLPEEEQIAIRIGIDLGPAAIQGQRVIGPVVRTAALIDALARSSQILISTTAEERIGSAFRLPRRPYDAVWLKSASRPLKVFEIHWDKDQKSEPATRPDGISRGTRLEGRFEILDELGKGGMGVVYQARDHALNEDVALKFIRSDLVGDPMTVKRFKSEVRLARSITHSNICRIHEFLEMEGYIFLSMELLRGTTLRQVIRREGALGPDPFGRVVRGVCQGLRAAHDKGITHRDLKPGNVMIEEDTGRVVLMDFGIAQMADSRRATQVGLFAGTPDYMSPEQVRGDVAGPASDIYALGVMMYQMVTGKLPHKGEHAMATAVSKLSEDPTPLDKVMPGLPEPLTRAVARCLKRDPEDRFSGVADLQATLWGRPAPAQPVAKPVAEPVAEPVIEPVVEPVAEPFPEPVAEPVDEPLIFEKENTDVSQALSAPEPEEPERPEIPDGGEGSRSLGRRLLAWIAVAISVSAITLIALLLVKSLSGDDEPGPGDTVRSTSIGFLSVEVAQPARLLIDGEQIPAQAPMKRRLLPVGRHRVVVKAEDGRVLLNEIVVIEKGITKVLHVGKPITRTKPRRKKRRKTR